MAGMPKKCPHRKCPWCGSKVIDITEGGKWQQMCDKACGWIWMDV